MARILLYSELLFNIRQVSIAASLPSPSGPATIAQLSADGSTICLIHDAERQEFTLPAAAKAPRFLPINQQKSRDLSWRLPLRDPETLDAPPPIENQSVPWSASELEPNSELHCRACGSLLVEQGRIHDWRDLPSENWAEMMEFWHCHKPPIESDHQENHDHLTSRGYGANSSLSAKTGVGFVDLMTFLLSEDDCSGVVYSLTTSRESSPDTPNVLSSVLSNLNLDGEQEHTQHPDLGIFCKACHARVGVFNIASASSSLFKWMISMSSIPTTLDSRPVHPPTMLHCLTSSLLAGISRTGCSKAILKPLGIDKQQTTPPNTTSTLLPNLWVISHGIKYSSSENDHVENAAKVLYRTVTIAEADKLLDPVTSDVQELRVPLEVIQQLLASLRTSNQLLPVSQRTLQGWDLGLVERWMH